MSEVFKIQQSIASSDKQRKILIYNKNREYYGECAASEEIIRMMRGKMKIYVQGDIDDAGKLQIERLVKPERW